MSFIPRLVILVATCASITLTHTTSSTRGETFATNTSKAQLQLTTSVLEQRYCPPDHVGLKLRLTFRNVGEEAVILHKQSAISRIMVSRDLTAASAKHYEQEQRSDDPGADIGLDSPNLSDFRILKPGQVFEFEEPVSVYLFNAQRSAERFLGEGTHFIQVDVGTWPYIADPAGFRKKWRDQGYLWYQGLTSQAMPFTIDKTRTITRCP